MRILDLYCGAGGAAIGMHKAYPDAEIVGIDVEPQKEYPFSFIQRNVLDVSEKFVRGFDFVWASPPCQLFSSATPVESRNNHKDFIPFTRGLLEKSGIPFVIENVPSAPIFPDLVLCGEMFKLKVIRHRHFEICGFFAVQPAHVKHKGLTIRSGRTLNRTDEIYYVGVHGNGEGTNIIDTWQRSMGIYHITRKRGLAQAIPPAYSEYIMREFLKRRGGQMDFFRT